LAISDKIGHAKTGSSICCFYDFAPSTTIIGKASGHGTITNGITSIIGLRNCRRNKEQHNYGQQQYESNLHLGINEIIRFGNVRIIMDMRRNINGKHVILIEDIVDTGYTLHFLLQILQLRNPATLECCVLLRKPKCLKVSEFPVKWVGFDVEPVFVVGYGLDFAEKYRTLPYIAELKEEAYKKS